MYLFIQLRITEGKEKRKGIICSYVLELQFRWIPSVNFIGRIHIKIYGVNAFLLVFLLCFYYSNDLVCFWTFILYLFLRCVYFLWMKWIFLLRTLLPSLLFAPYNTLIVQIISYLYCRSDSGNIITDYGQIVLQKTPQIFA